MVFVRCAIMALVIAALPVEASPDDSKTFIRYFGTNWVYDFSAAIDQWPVSVGANRENVVIIDPPGNLRCMDRTSGSNKWTTIIPPLQKMAPVVSDSLVFVLARGNSSIAAYRINDGQLAWTASTGSAPVAVCMYPSLVVISNLVYVVTTKGNLVAMTYGTGELRWVRELHVLQERLPRVWRDRLFAVTKDNQVLALDARTGQTIWHHSIDSHVNVDMVVDGSDLYFVVQSGLLYKVSCDTGEILLKTSIPPAQLSPIIIGSKVIIVGSVTAGSASCLVTVDSNTGQIVQRRMCPRVATSGLFDGKFLWCTTAYNELYLIDAGNMCPRMVLQVMPQPLSVISDSPTPLFLAGKQLIAGRVDEEAIRRMKYLGRMGSGYSGPQVLGVSIFIAGFMVLLWLSFSGGHTIPPTHETTGLMYGCYIVMAMVSVYLVLNAMLICGIIGYDRPTALRVVALSILLLPLVGVLASWLAQGPRLRRFYGQLRHLCAESHDPVVVESFTHLSELMRLGKRVELMTAPQHGFSPYVVIAGFNRCILVVPANLRSMCMTACDNDYQLAVSLIRVILAHEMAHFVTKDAVLVPFTRGFRSYMALSAVLLVGVSLALVQYPDVALRGIVQPALVLSCCVGALVVALTVRFGYARERVADAAATLAVQPSDLESLLASSSQGVSPLEAFLFILSIAPSAEIHDQIRGIRFAISTALPNRLRQDATERRSALKARSSLLPRKAHNIILVAVLAALTGGIIYQLSAEILRACVCLANIPQVISHIWYGAALKEQWHISSSYLAAALWTLAPILSAIAVSATLLLPLRDAFFQDLRANPKVLAGLCGVIVLCGTLAELASGLISRLTTAAHPTMDYVTVSDIPCSLAIIIFGIFMLALILVRWAYILQQPRRVVLQMLSVFGVMSLGSGLIMIMFTDISVTARILLIFLSATIAVILSSILRIFTRSGYIPTEWMNYERIIMSWRYTVKHLAHEKYLSRRVVLSGFSASCAYYLVLMTVAAFAIYPFLIGFEGWYDQHLPQLYAKLAELNQLVTGESPPSIVAAIWHYGALAILLALTETLSITAAEAVLWILVCIMAIVLIVGMVLDLVFRYASPFTRVAYVPVLDRISNLLGVNLVPARLLAKYRMTILRYMSKADPYLQWPRHVPRMKSTCQALQMSSIEIPQARRAAANEWVQRCADPGGGFGCAPGQSANPLHTHAALELLMPMGLLSDEELSRHLQWIRSQLSDMAASTESYPPAAFLSYAALLLASHALISGRPATFDQQEGLRGMIIQRWRRSDQTIEDARNAVVSLQYLAVDGELLLEDLKGNWLPLKEDEVVRIDPKTRLEDILYMVEIDRILYPRDFRSRACIAQLISILAVTFGAQKELPSTKN